LIERALTLDFLSEPRNYVIIGSNGLGKTMIAKNIAHAAVLAGHSVLFRTAADLLADLEGDSPGLRRRKFRFYARPTLLVIDECGYLAYDATPPTCSSKSSTSVTSAKPSCSPPIKSSKTGTLSSQCHLHRGASRPPHPSRRHHRP